MSIKTDENYLKKIEELKEYLNSWIGFYYWETYYTTWFWTNISMPINLSLTLSTALIAAQASSTGNLLSEHDYMILSFTTMILTTVNSYFKPQIKSMDSNAVLIKWIDLGYKLDDLAFDIKTVEDQYIEYKKLFSDVSKQASTQAGNKNFLTSWWHYALRKWYGPESENWISSKPIPDVKKSEKKNEVVIEMTELKKG